MTRGRALAFTALSTGGVAMAAMLACGGAEFSSAAFDAGAEAAPVIDSGGKGASDAADAGGPFCASHGTAQGYDFCSDFDDAQLPESWDLVTHNGGGAVSEDPDASVSPPNSALVTTPSRLTALGDAGAQALLQKASLRAGEAHVELDLRIDALAFPNPADTSASVSFLGITFGKGSGDYALALTFVPGGTGAPYALYLVEVRAADGGTQSDVTAIKTLPQPGVWTHVKIDLPSPGTSELDLTLTNDATGVASAKQAITLTPTVGAALELHALAVGITTTGSAGAAAIHVDNVTWSH